MTAPYGTRWPGLAPDRKLAADPDSMACQYAVHLLSRERPLRLGLVAADRGADALAADRTQNIASAWLSAARPALGLPSR